MNDSLMSEYPWNEMNITFTWISSPNNPFKQTFSSLSAVHELKFPKHFIVEFWWHLIPATFSWNITKKNSWFSWNYLPMNFSSFKVFLHQQAIFLSLFKKATINECIVFRWKPVLFTSHHNKKQTQEEQGQIVNVV